MEATIGSRGSVHDGIEAEVSSGDILQEIRAIQRQGASRMSDDRIKNRLMGAQERAAEREAHRAEQEKMLAQKFEQRMAGCIVDVQDELKRVRQRLAEIELEVPRLVKTRDALAHLLTVYGEKQVAR